VFGGVYGGAAERTETRSVSSLAGLLRAMVRDAPGKSESMTWAASGGEGRGDGERLAVASSLSEMVDIVVVVVEVVIGLTLLQRDMAG